MYQESRGEGNDPMQSSESLGLKPNEIQETSLSIKQGVKHFVKMYKYGTEKDVSMDTIIQSYNMGPGYIDFIASQEVKQHSEDSAKNFLRWKSIKIQQCTLVVEIKIILGIHIVMVISNMPQR